MPKGKDKRNSDNVDWFQSLGDNHQAHNRHVHNQQAQVPLPVQISHEDISDPRIHTISMKFEDLPIDRSIIYRDYKHTVSPYTYVTKVIALNTDRLCSLYNLRSIVVKSSRNIICVSGENMQSVRDAMEGILSMLEGPVLTMKLDADMVVGMRLFNDIKKDFSAQTGCWLHFIWVSRTVTCYGLDGKAADEYLRRSLQALWSCLMDAPTSFANLPPDKMVVVDRCYDRRLSKFIKKKVDEIEQHSGAILAIKSEDVGMNLVKVQLFGTIQCVEAASEYIETQGKASMNQMLSVGTTITGMLNQDDGQDKVGTRLSSNMMEDPSSNFNASRAITQGGPSSLDHGLQGTTSLATPSTWTPQSLNNHSPNGPALPESPLTNFPNAASGTSTLAAICRDGLSSTLRTATQSKAKVS
uniref:K Homology domain-containing protein n=1 Tax=Eutreptiella gymnastica TaxID=73025 RepID=A0A7S1I2C1_9EUGL